jgi:hypothetical protein
MSSRKAATAKTAVRRTATPVPAKPASKPAAKVQAKAAETKEAKAANGSASAEAKALATKIERDLRDGKLDTLSPEAFQALMAALCKSYRAQLEGGANFLPVANHTSVSPTEVMTTTSALLKAANLAVFELGMWQSWTGR